MVTVFDHTKTSLKEALGFDDNDMHQIHSKLADTSKYILRTSCPQGELCEEIAKTFSYNELLFITTLFVMEKTNTIVGQHLDLVAIMHLKEMLEDLNKKEE